MAKAVLKVRAVYLSEDCRSYWRFHVSEHGRSQAPGDRCIASSKSSHTLINSQGKPGNVGEYGDQP